VGTLDAEGAWVAGTPVGVDFPAARFTVEATSPGTWANGTRVDLRFRASGLTGRPEVDVAVQVPGERQERFTRVAPSRLVEALQASRFVRLRAPDAPPPGPAGPGGPRSARWKVTLGGGSDDSPRATDYLDAVAVLQELAEPALIAVPDLHDELNGSDAGRVVEELLATSAATRDRLLLVDIPAGHAGTASAVRWLDALRGGSESARSRNAAAYHPRLKVRDPLGGISNPLREIPASGHVAGLISRLDRERGAGHSPANASLFEAVDVSANLAGSEQAALTGAGINVLRCAAGGGLEVWGARTLDREPTGRFVAHNRLIHRLVRAIRRVAEPLVFENQNAELRFTFTRSVTSVLLEAWRSGALKGARPEQAFSVQCDEANNPPEQRELGQVICDISLAPAVPMEFIQVRIALSANGLLEVVEQ
jgi:phage tail sheath protein FI